MYNIELEINTTFEDRDVKELAEKFNCDSVLSEEVGPLGNPVYLFSSENFNDLVDIACVVLNTSDFDEETIKLMIVEV